MNSFPEISRAADKIVNAIIREQQINLADEHDLMEAITFLLMCTMAASEKDTAWFDNGLCVLSAEMKKAP